MVIRAICACFIFPSYLGFKLVDYIYTSTVEAKIISYISNNNNANYSEIPLGKPPLLQQKCGL